MHGFWQIGRENMEAQEYIHKQQNNYSNFRQGSHEEYI